MLNIAGSLLALTAVLAYLNRRFIGLPATIGVMSIALLLSAVLLALDMLGYGTLRNLEKSLIASIDFSDVLMQGMLSVLLFAGALHVDLSELKAYRWQVGALALFSTLGSMLSVGFGLWYLLPLVGVALPLSYCLVFGALIAPTDPVAVMGILKSAGAPASLELVIAGESLFNDGVGVVLFSLALGMAASGTAPSISHGAMLLLKEAGGGIVLGLAIGYVTFRLLKSLDSYQEEVLITLAAVTGGYALASNLHVSGPLSMVVAGLIVGNHARAEAMSDLTRKNVDMFWELLDAIFNAVLFVLIGLEVIVLSFSAKLLLAGLLVVVVTLGARTLTAGLPAALLRKRSGLPQGAGEVLTWGGLRGGISVALALSLPAGREHDIVVSLTYVVVVFSILVQGLSIGRLVQKVVPCSPK
ncbi:MAG TPA: sodium:proton antiporter [Noviherbaspirillum sp.]